LASGIAASARADELDLRSVWADLTKPEIRVGASTSFHGPEVGRPAVTGAFILPKPNFGLGRWDPAAPRIQISGVVNVKGGTSYAATDFIWTLNLDKRWFFEPYIGVAVHNGQLDGPDWTKASLGCRALIHAGFNVGYRIDKHWSIIGVFDHVSNAQSLSGCVQNQGLNLAGGQIGYAF
jgi:hypothetical protein